MMVWESLAVSPPSSLLASSHFAVNFHIYIWHLSEVLLITTEAKIMLINDSSSQKTELALLCHHQGFLKNLSLALFWLKKKIRGIIIIRFDRVDISLYYTDENCMTEILSLVQPHCHIHILLKS